MFTYKGVKFIKTVYRPYCPLMASLFFVGFGNQKRWHRYLGFNYKLQDAIEIEGVYYYPEYHLDNFAKKATQHILKAEANFLSLKKETLLREKAVLKGIKKNKINEFSSFLRDFIEYQPTLALYHICDDFIEDALRIELLKTTNESEVDVLMSHINLPLKLNLDQIAKRKLLKTGDIDDFIKSHSWNFSRYGKHAFLTRQEAKVILKSLQKDPNFTNSREGIGAAIKRAKKLLKGKGYYVDVMQFFIYYRTHRTDIFNKVFFAWHGALKEFASQKGLTYEDLIHCSYLEIINNQIPNLKILAARQKEFVVCLSHNEIKVFSGKEADAFKKLSSEKNTKQIIAGRTAFPGIIKGKVKIISKHQDLDNFKKGEVLVASMTTPSMVMAMKKAAAFITDEGGITCHAAILAREMKKPCVIGTKNATKILKDGYLVEVDAKKGMVKVIRK